MKQVKTLKGARRFFRYIGDKVNDKSYNLSKASEEIAELQELVLKTLNKRAPNKPSKQSIIDEIGDVEMRIYILKRDLKITQQEINERKIYKANKFIGYIKSGDYKKNI